MEFPPSPARPDCGDPPWCRRRRTAGSAASVISSGKLKPAAWERLIVIRTVEAATPTPRAISRFGTPPTNLKHDRSLCRVQAHPWQSGTGAELASRGTRSRARSCRNGGRNHPGTAGGFTPESADRPNPSRLMASASPANLFCVEPKGFGLVYEARCTSNRRIGLASATDSGRNAFRAILRAFVMWRAFSPT